MGEGPDNLWDLVILSTLHTLTTVTKVNVSINQVLLGKCQAKYKYHQI